MAGRILAMSKAEEIKRLKGLGLSDRAIARSLNIHRRTVKKYLDQINEVLPPAPVVEPSWAENLRWEELISEAQRGTPVSILWEELIEKNAIGIQYPGFWKQFKKRCPTLTQTMHRVFAPGSRCEIDYADGLELLNPGTGEIIKTQLFVGVLCHSRYVFAEFTLSQSSADFLSSHVKMFEHFGGVPQVVSPDNLKSAVTKSHRYDPVLNPAYTRLASHYGFAVVPARVRTPKDKAIVERTIQIFQRWFYFKVRHRTFTSLIELNQVLKEHVEIFHHKKHRIFRRTRLEMFEGEKPSLQTLPENRYEVATHHKARLHADCHLMVEKNYYSSPYQLRGQELDVWLTPTTVEIYKNGERVGFHPRAKGKEGKFVTDSKHYPPEHQAYCEATPQYVRDQALKIGPETTKLITTLMAGPYPLKYLRRAQGIIRLAGVYGHDLMEGASQQANTFKITTYVFIERLLRNSKIKPIKTKSPIRDPSNPLLRRETLFH
jgi:transposase